MGHHRIQTSFRQSLTLCIQMLLLYAYRNLVNQDLRWTQIVLENEKRKWTIQDSMNMKVSTFYPGEIQIAKHAKLDRKL